MSNKKVADLGIAWERAFGYVPAGRVKDTIGISGQWSHDGDGELAAPANLDVDGQPAGFSPMEALIRQTCVKAKKLLAVTS